MREADLSWRRHQSGTRAALFTKQLDVAERAAHPLAEAAHLHKAGLERIPETDGNEEEHQQVADAAVQQGYDGLKRGFQSVHGMTAPFVRQKKRTAENIHSSAIIQSTLQRAMQKRRSEQPFPARFVCRS